MPTKRDQAAARLAAATKMMSEEQARQCLKTVVDAEARGKKATVIDVMVQQELITPGQGEDLLKKAQSEARRRIGDYEVLSKLGEGGMGQVWRARHIPMDRIVALKTLSKQLSSNTQFVERFYREARASAKLEHPHVVRGYDVGEADGIHYFAMEFIDGQSVQDVLDEDGALEVGEALRIVRDVASALAHAQTLSMVHRDVKPDNIMLTRQGVVKLADLGLAKQTDEESHLTQTGAGFGTPYYMAPEQAKNAKYVDGRSDIYALGATLYHMVTGVVPYDGDTAMEVLLKKEEGEYAPSRQHNASVTERLDLVIEKMMSPDPKHRHQTCEELIAELESTGLLPAPSPASSAPAPAQTEPTRPAKSAPARTGAGGKPGARTKGSGRPKGTSRPKGKEVAKPGHWYVRFRDNTGKAQRVLGDTASVRKMIQKGVIGTRAKVSNKPDTDYRPIASVPEFLDLMASRLVQERAESRSTTNMADAYANMERQYARKKLFRKLTQWARTGAVLLLAGVGLYLVYVYFLKDLLAGHD